MNPRIFAQVLSVGVLFILPFIQNCEWEEPHVQTLKWISKGNRLTYDLYYAGRSISNGKTLEIFDNAVGEELRFIESLSDDPSDPFGDRLLLGMFSNLIVEKDGLHATVCMFCNIGACFRPKSFLKVPISPVKFQQLPDYVCGEKISGYDMVLNVDSTVTVPVGKFQTVVILDTVSKTVKFWNEQTGLVRVDNFSDRSDTIKLLLSSKNY